MPQEKVSEAKILFIGDSISSSVDMRQLSTATQSTFVTARAYSSIHDTVSNVAKQAARFLEANFTDVVPAELKKAKFETLILQAGSVDITNLNTKDNPSEYVEYFKQETIMSATNLFKSGERAFSIHPSLKKVVLMKQIPRYDPPSVDPTGLKPALSQLFNNTMTELWMKSNEKNRLFIGSHDIECTGAIRESRYKQPKTGKFDGIHLLGNSGQKAYTLSSLKILQAAKLTSSEQDYHQSCAQFQYQSRQVRNKNSNMKHFQHNQKGNVTNNVGGSFSVSRVRPQVFYIFGILITRAKR